MKKRAWLFLTCLFAVVSMAFAQRTVTGVVIDSSTGEPVIGASVLVKGTTVGNATNLEGRFTINNVPESAKHLVVSYIGMKKTEVAIKANMKIFMDPEDASLDDVLVVAYGTQKKSAYTGAAAEIKSDKIENRQITNASQALVGTMSGVQTIQSSGEPGSSVSVRIRGISSLHGDNAPLWVVDGVPYDGDITAINTNDIESMTVLKDAVSTSLYGSRGANGVIMVTTKKGKMGEAKITLDAKWGSVSREVRNYDVIRNPDQYMELVYNSLYNGYLYNGGYSADESFRLANQNLINRVGYQVYTVPQGQYLIGSNGKLNPNATLGYSDGEFYYTPDNWEDETFQPQLRQEYNVGISGANERLNYYVSFGYLDDGGLVENSGFERLSTRANVEYKVKDWLKIGTNMGFSHTNSNSPSGTDKDGDSGNAFWIANTIAPIYPFYVRNADGQIMRDPSSGKPVYDYGNVTMSTNFSRPSNAGGGGHPVSDYTYSRNESNMDIFNGNWYATADLSHGFTATARFGLHSDNTILNQMQSNLYGQYIAYGGFVANQQTRVTSFDHQYLLNYANTFGKHSVNATAGFDGYQYKSQVFYIMGYNMYDPNDYTAGNVIDNKDGSGGISKYNTAGYFITANYDYDQRFYANVGYRRDGTSVFAPKNRWGDFFSLGFGWNMKKESWLKDIDAIDLLKYKISFGQQGNDNHAVNLYAYLDQYSISGADGVFSDGVLSFKGNEDLKWEKTNSFNTGFDFSFFKGRLSGSADFFFRATSNLLDYKKVASSNGYTSIPVNMGTIQNLGVEFDFTYGIFRTKEFNWDVNFNMTHVANRIHKLAPEYNGEYINGSNIYKEGGTIYNFYLVKWAGVSEETGEAMYWAKDAETGDYYKTTNYDTAYNTAREDRGSALAKLYGGLSTNLSWKGIDFSIQTSWQIGGKVYDNGYAGLMHGGTSTTIGTNWHKDILNAWTPENTKTDVPRLDYSDQYANSLSTRFLTNASYFSIDNITIGYTLPKKWTMPLGIEGVRVYGSAENLCIFTARKGLDPRMSITAAGNSTYSSRRVISGGIKVTF